MNATLQAVLWDLDGVLVDTSALHFQAWRQALDPLGIDYSWETFNATFGMNNASILELLLGRPPTPEDMRSISDTKEIAFRRIVPGAVQPLPGVLDWLQRFRTAGIAQAIASSAPPENIDLLAAELGIRSYFTAVISGFDLPGKPAPDTFQKAAAALNVLPSDCLVIEDAVAGIEAARRAGIRVIAVATTRTPGDLQAADLVLPGLEALLPEHILRLGLVPPIPLTGSSRASASLA